MGPSTAGDITFDEQTALVVVDMQNDFADPHGGLAVPGGTEVIPVINELVFRAKDSGSALAYTQDWHPEETPHFDKDGGTWPVHCVQGTWGARLHPSVRVEGPVIQKGSTGEDGYSGFTARDVTTGQDQGTGLEETLRDHGAERVVVVGLAQDVCVKETALDARRLGFETTVVRAATRPVNLYDGDEEAAEKAMTEAGVTLA